MKAAVFRYLLVSAFACAMALFIAQSDAVARDYSEAGALPIETRMETWHDAKRNRDVPVKIVAPRPSFISVSAPASPSVSPPASTSASKPLEALPVILFSHGLGGSVESGRFWGEHWASHGYIVIHLQHPGSDEAVWKDAAPAQRRAALKQAGNAANLLLRIQDTRFAIDEVLRRNAAGEAQWKRADTSRIGMSGHSFGAHTTLGVTGQSFPAANVAAAADPRVKAAIAFSPKGNPRAGPLDAQFAGIRIPMLSFTGSKDGDVIGDGTQPSDRALPYENMPGPDKFLAWFDEAEHSDFGGQERPDQARLRPSGAGAGRKSEIRSDVKALSLAFWDAFLKGDAAARDWLKRDAVRILAANDSLKSK